MKIIIALCFLIFKYFHMKKNILLALIEIILLWLVIYETYLIFKKIDKKASYLLLPYLECVGFANILTSSIFCLNK